MCLCLYIGIDDPIALVPWESEEQHLCVEPVGAVEEIVRKHLSKPYVYYVGAYEGCGCGFVLYDEYNGYEEMELTNKQESREALKTFLSSLLQDGREAEILVCWADDEAKLPSQRIVGTADDLMRHLACGWKSAFIRLVSHKTRLASG